MALQLHFEYVKRRLCLEVGADIPEDRVAAVGWRRGHGGLVALLVSPCMLLPQQLVHKQTHRRASTNREPL